MTLPEITVARERKTVLAVQATGISATADAMDSAERRAYGEQLKRKPEKW